jgi:hypothetical protein
MRAPLLGDVVAAARALRAVDEKERLPLLSQLMAEADAAERQRRETGRNHPRHGDGSLMAAALRHPCVAEPALDDDGYCACLALVLSRVAARRDAGGNPAVRQLRTIGPLSS